MVLVSHFDLHDITYRCVWRGVWAFGEPGCSGPQNCPLPAPLVQFASLIPIFQTSCALPSLPPAGVEVSWNSVCYDGPIILPLGVSLHSCPRFSCGALSQHSCGVSLPPICLIHLLLTPGELGVGHNLVSLGRGGCQYECEFWGGHHCLGEEWGRAENPPSSCLRSPASPLLGVGLKTLLPNLGVLSPSLPSSSDYPLNSGWGTSHCQCVYGTWWVMGVLASLQGC